MSIKFPAQRYIFNWVAESNISLPSYSGSILRGHFGNQLRRTVCFTKQEKCAGCPLIQRCSYGRMYETIPATDELGKQFNKLPHPYIIEPLEYGRTWINAGAEFSYNMVLIGDTLAELPLIIYIWEQIFQRGFKHRDNLGYAKLVNVMLDDGSIIYANNSELENQEILPHLREFVLPPVDSNLTHCHIKLLTPLRLQGRDAEGKSIIIGAELFDLTSFLQGLFRRITMLAQAMNLVFDLPQLQQPFTSLTINNSNLRWTKTRRFSRAQNAEMDFYGIIGEFSILGIDVAKLYPWLKLGELLHIGKSTTFGFGAYKVDY